MRLAATRSSISAGSTGPPDAGAWAAPSVALIIRNNALITTARTTLISALPIFSPVRINHRVDVRSAVSACHARQRDAKPCFTLRRQSGHLAPRRKGSEDRNATGV